MSAEFDTTVTIKGSEDELKALLKVLRYYQDEMYERYCNGEECAYLEDFSASDEEILATAKNNGGSVEFEIIGPYGYFVDPDEIELFDDMAKAAPNSYFKCHVEGFNCGADIDYTYELKDGEVNQESKFFPFDEDTEDDEERID